MIDYVEHGRPPSDCPQVFIRHTAPIGPFSDQDHLHQILVKHARAVHVPLGEKRRLTSSCLLVGSLRGGSVEEVS